MTAAGNDTRTFAWRVEQGERETLSIPIFSDPAEAEERDVTGWTVDAKVKTRPMGEVLYTWPAEHVTIIGNDVELVLPGPVSAQWDWIVGWFRVRLTAPDYDPADPDTSRVIQGPFAVDPD